MLWLYNFAIFFYSLIIRVAAVFFPKAKLFLTGRKNIFLNIKNKIDSTSKNIWFHFASLGEFEQGRPVLEELRKLYPDRKIVITFFSPSGYEIRKNYELADAVFYLPMDTAKNAREFIDLVKPELAVFTKYDFWYHYFKTLNREKIPLLLISGIFRPNQVFFKWYGGFNRQTLKFVTHFFVQNEESVELLKSIKIDQVSLSGDTRFDRVAHNASNVKKNLLVEGFIEQSQVLIAGSTWPPDEALISELIFKYSEWKLIVAPHEIGEGHLEQIQRLFPNAVRYSQLLKEPYTKAQTLIIDNIGILSSLYQYGRVCYIGGGFGAGIHNTLEAAAFGIPVIFGPRYGKFQEAKDLIKLGSAISINNIQELENAFDSFVESEKYGAQARLYVDRKKGATFQITEAVKNILG
jgi:3-deoxy-D-manno-octulosonic-acid transferase